MGGATRHVGLSAVRHQHASRQQRKGENGGPQDKKNLQWTSNIISNAVFV